ncbi:hypothetical protein MIR68_003960 [Amoeboaphelidium protococcarum]|nr:hypothetical protein MIR68_003960 [Amoeboaphelidium protococcarum]
MSSILKVKNDVPKLGDPGVDYCSWSVEVEFLLMEKGCWQVVEGCVSVINEDAVKKQQAVSMDQKAQGTIWECLGKGAKNLIIALKTKYETEKKYLSSNVVWSHLEKQYSRSTSLNKLQSLRHFICISQNKGEKLKDYVHRLQDSSNRAMTAVTDGKVSWNDLQLAVVLHGIDKEFDSLRLNLEMKLNGVNGQQGEVETLDFSEVLSILLNEQEHKDAKSVSKPIVNTNQDSTDLVNFMKKDVIVCQYEGCGKKGHSIEKCWKKENDDKKRENEALKKENQILKQKTQKVSQVTDPIISSSEQSSAFEAIFNIASSANSSSVNKTVWYLDSGASTHCCNQTIIFQYLHQREQIDLKLWWYVTYEGQWSWGCRIGSNRKQQEDVHQTYKRAVHTRSFMLANLAIKIKSLWGVSGCRQ